MSHADFPEIASWLPALGQRGRSVLAVDVPDGLANALASLCEEKAHSLSRVDSVEVHGGQLGTYDAILVASAFEPVFAEGNLWGFFDGTLALLAPGGALLIVDVPNASARRRHRAGAAPPGIEHGAMDDAVVLGMLLRARLQGLDAYVLPGENILVTRP